MKKTMIARLTTVIALTMIFSQSFKAQGKTEISAGGGFFDGLFIKARYGTNIQIGVSQGYGAGTGFDLTAIEILVRLKKSSYPDAFRKCYLMCGFGTVFTGGYEPFEKSMLYPRLGRSFFFSKEKMNAGINAEAGITFLRSTNPPDGYVTDIIPFSASVGFFYRF